MAEHPNLSLSPDERRLFARVFSAADIENLGVVTGDVALRFFPERTKLPPETLGEIWQIADIEDKGFLTPPGFGIVLRLIGYAQAGRPVSAELALKPGGPLPRFEGINGSPNPAPGAGQVPLQPQVSGGPIRVPPLAPEKANQYAALFEESGAQDGLLSGATAKQIFDRAQLPNDVLVRIWNLADTEQRGMLSVTEFIIAMHLLASYRAGALRALPQTLPSGLYEAAARRGVPQRPVSGSRPAPDMPPTSAIPRQFSGMGPPRTSSPLARAPYTSPAVSAPPSATQSQPGAAWAISAQEKAQFDRLFAQVDTEHHGYVTGEQAATFFSNSKLPEDDLAQIWDLVDINSEGQLRNEQFAVAMYLIRQQLSKSGPLPMTLPPNLVPPSMRRQPVAPSQPGTTPFDNSANVAKPKSASEDLFGLDAFTTPTPQVPQSTGGSTTPAAASPHPTSSPLQPQHTQQSTVFKPFVPSSSFGQTMMTPQGTGASASAASPGNRGLQQQQKPSPMDDLLGDNDPEISKRLTQETTELANLSNQVGTLTHQMQEVKSQRASTEQDVSQVSVQKRDFETRLSQLRSAYEQEVRDVKALEERLNLSKSETKKVQQDFAMVQHTYQNLQEQHQQVAAALDADQKESSSLKERMRQVNSEIGQLKPQLEKLRSDARQQKGLVAINKKQLSTLEAERDRVRGDLDGATQELHEATHELEESKRSLEAASQTQLAPSAVVSPAPSSASQSMNPFFRRATNPSTERGMSQSPFTPQTVASPNHNAFDSFFGPSLVMSSPNESSGHNNVSSSSFFEPEPSAPHQSGSPSGLVRELHGEPSNLAVSNQSPTTQENLPSSNAVPPAPPQSRQITSSFLPLRDNRSNPSSPSSSVGVAAPTSRFGDTSGLVTPMNERQISQAFRSSELNESTNESSLNPTNTLAHNSISPFPERNLSVSNESDSHRPTAIGTAEANNGFRDMGQPSAPPDIPGAFPTGSTPFHTPVSSSGQLAESSRGPNSPFHNDNITDDRSPATKLETKNPSSANDDFDSAFTGFPSNGKAPEQNDTVFPSTTTQSRAPPAAHSEFPPIQEFGADDDSESDSDRGFDDDFSPITPQRQQAPEQSSAPAEGLKHPAELRPEFERASSNTSQLPTPNAQQFPPTYDSTVFPNGHSEHRDSNQFPAEYGGLLPSRKDPTSPPVASQSPETPVRSASNGDASSFFGGMTSKERALSGTSIPAAQMPMAPGTTAAPFAYDNTEAQSQAPASSSQPSIPAKNAFDDFENEFGDLSEARAADDKGEDDLTSSYRDGFDEFNPAFDSPAPSKATSSSILQNDNAFHDFESSIMNTGPVQSSTSKLVSQPSTEHDWDAMFAGLDTPAIKANGNGTEGSHSTIPPKESDISSAGPSSTSTKPSLGRALTTEHDDPILKRLTGMGYPREESLAALERFDYNLDKAADYLTSKT
ncbi:hypothetical protein MMC30_001452 [Trapelia coarctata]|nr:hypothetical protein [Trapelia coarctata]